MNAPATPWEFDYWTPEPFWKCERVFVLASGPSLADTAWKIKRYAANCIVINKSFRLAPWARVWYFTDSSIYEAHRDDVKSWHGDVITMSRAAKRELNKRVLRVKGEGDPSAPNAHLQDFPKPGHPAIRQGRSSGHTAISLAIALGARQVIMLGFDMRFVGGREHHHQEYTGPRDLELYAREFVPGFEGWNAAALRAGVTVLNATPGSAVTEFPLVDLDEVLCARS